MSTAETAIAPTPGRPALRIARCMEIQAAGGARASVPSTSGRRSDLMNVATARSP
jgi:hypothetical protein